MLLITSTANIKTWERDNGLYGGLSPLARGAQHRKRLRGGGVRFIPAGAGSSTWRIFATPARTVYPRWRGELGIARLIRRRPYGLSPLARGTRPPRRCIPRDRRFIPAGAGNTLSYFFIVHIHAVYPRWRGEHGPGTSAAVRYPGLSPLARGTRIAGIRWYRQNRFIPAGAGNTLSSLSHWEIETVYPRWRGEHETLWESVSKNTGLSPLARGTLRCYADRAASRRFIPAGAGNT